MGRSGASWIAVAVLATAVTIVVFVPLALPPPELEPDLSLRATMHEAFARKLQFGTEIIYTYGPWGILQRGDADPRTRRVVLWVSLLIAITVTYALVMMAREAGGRPSVAAGAVLAAGALLVAGGRDAGFVGVELLLMLWCLIAPPGSRRVLPLVALIALIALIKLSYLALALFVIAVVVAVRRRVSELAAFLVALTAAWILAGQQLSGLPSFFYHGAAIVAGYSGGAGLPYPVTADVICAAIGTTGLIVLAMAIERDAVRAGAVAGAAFFVFKLGYVRHDDVHGQASGALLFFLGLGYLLVRSGHPRLAGRRRMVVIGGIAALAIVMAADGPLLVDAAKDAMRAHTAVDASTSGLPALRGSIDAYPWGSVPLIARGLQYEPRPIFESYMAWTPALAELNAQHLRGARAPAWLWVASTSVDKHPPMLEDAPSWPEIFGRYDVDRRIGDWLLLRKRPAPQPFRRIPIGSMRVPFDSTTALPDVGDDLLWCSIDASPTIAARIVGVLLCPSRMTLQVTTADGAKASYALPAAMAGGGFILSPRVDSAEELESLVRQRGGGHRVTAIRVGTESVLREPFGEAFAVRVERLRFALSE